MICGRPFPRRMFLLLKMHPPVGKKENKCFAMGLAIPRPPPAGEVPTGAFQSAHVCVGLTGEGGGALVATRKFSIKQLHLESRTPTADLSFFFCGPKVFNHSRSSVFVMLHIDGATLRLRPRKKKGSPVQSGGMLRTYCSHHHEGTLGKKCRIFLFCPANNRIDLLDNHRPICKSAPIHRHSKCSRKTPQSGV